MLITTAIFQCFLCTRYCSKRLTMYYFVKSSKTLSAVDCYVHSWPYRAGKWVFAKGWDLCKVTSSTEIHPVSKTFILIYLLDCTDPPPLLLGHCCEHLISLIFRGHEQFFTWFQSSLNSTLKDQGGMGTRFLARTCESKCTLFRRKKYKRKPGWIGENGTTCTSMPGYDSV